MILNRSASDSRNTPARVATSGARSLPRPSNPWQPAQRDSKACRPSAIAAFGPCVPLTACRGFCPCAPATAKNIYAHASNPAEQTHCRANIEKTLFRIIVVVEALLATILPRSGPRRLKMRLASEPELRRNLQDARIVRRRNYPKRARIDAAVRSLKLCMIENVERLEAELQRLRFRELCVFQ